MRPALEVADIFRRHGPAYRRIHDGHLGRGERRVMAAIELCRTAALGGMCRAMAGSPIVKSICCRYPDLYADGVEEDERIARARAAGSAIRWPAPAPHR